MILLLGSWEQEAWTWSQALALGDVALPAVLPLVMQHWLLVSFPSFKDHKNKTHMFTTWYSNQNMCLKWKDKSKSLDYGKNQYDGTICIGCFRWGVEKCWSWFWFWFGCREHGWNVGRECQGFGWGALVVVDIVGVVCVVSIVSIVSCWVVIVDSCWCRLWWWWWKCWGWWWWWRWLQ